MNEKDTQRIAELRRGDTFESLAYCLWADLKASGMLAERYEEWPDTALLPEVADLIEGRLRALVPALVTAALAKATVHGHAKQAVPQDAGRPVLPDLFFGKARRLERGQALSNMIKGDSNCFIIHASNETVVATCLAEPGLARGDLAILGIMEVAPGRDAWMAMGDPRVNPKAYGGGRTPALATGPICPREYGTFRDGDEPVYAIWMADRPTREGEKVALVSSTISTARFAVPFVDEDKPVA